MKKPEWRSSECVRHLGWFAYGIHSRVGGGMRLCCWISELRSHVVIQGWRTELLVPLLSLQPKSLHWLLGPGFAISLLLDFSSVSSVPCTQQHTNTAQSTIICRQAYRLRIYHQERCRGVIVYNRPGSVFIVLHRVQIIAANPSWSTEVG